MKALKERIAPGIWVDVEDALHFSIPELLELFGWEDTPKNRAEVTSIARKVIAEMNPNATVVESQEPWQEN